MQKQMEGLNAKKKVPERKEKGSLRYRKSMKEIAVGARERERGGGGEIETKMKIRGDLF